MMKSNLTNLNYINIFDKLTLDNYYKTDTHWKEEDLFNVANTIANQMNFDITNNNNAHIMLIINFFIRIF